MTHELYLTCMSGPLDGQILRFESDVVTFGRQPDCLVVLTSDPEISRLHARMFWSEGSWGLEDLGSSNGTFVGEFGQSQQITRTVGISIGQIFRVGRSRFRLEESLKQEQGSASQKCAVVE